MESLSVYFSKSSYYWNGSTPRMLNHGKTFFIILLIHLYIYVYREKYYYWVWSLSSSILMECCVICKWDVALWYNSMVTSSIFIYWTHRKGYDLIKYTALFILILLSEKWEKQVVVKNSRRKQQMSREGKFKSRLCFR